ncbi:hypothetical protein DVR12_14965 [Chitinophaga silvatica]|uniref:Uncharacterized protein n=1 Tax=Chitinophaga silvatica TaxID=2282649 RepID=A0A3E1Y9S6_9BACT|nr:hypothetical protein DVR12_14965 [Chitinophaga silvatica]
MRAMPQRWCRYRLVVGRFPLIMKLVEYLAEEKKNSGEKSRYTVCGFLEQQCRGIALKAGEISKVM